MRLPFLALFAGLLSCQTATQITVKLRGVGVSCPSGDSPTIEQTGVLAKRKLQSRSDLPELGVLGDQCDASEESVVSLGDIVLVPADGPGPVEVLALGALKVGDAAAVSAEDCRSEYERLFGSPCEIGEGRDCESCIFARRSVAFVKHSKLEITIDLDATCAGVICDPSQTCSKGACVSAETSCAEDGSCILDNENQGGAGAGGSPPVGGSGGAGGGGGGEIWVPLWEADSTDCVGAHPHDVLAAQVDANGSDEYRVIVAAGRCLLEIGTDGATSFPETPPANGDAYRAVAAGPGGEVYAFGNVGYTLRSNGAPYSLFNNNFPLFSPSASATSWDVAFTPGNVPIAWGQTLTNGPTTQGIIQPFAPGGAVDGINRPAVFTAFTARQGMLPVTFGAYGGTLESRRGAVELPAALTPSVSGWSLWAEELTSDAGAFQAVAVGAHTTAVHVGYCAASDKTAVDCVFEDDTLTPLPTPASDRKVLAIWGLQGFNETALYAIGQDDGEPPWLGRAKLPTRGALGQTIAWTFAPLPAGLLQVPDATVESVWAGRAEGGDLVLIVVGAGGVFQARIDDLEFSMEP